MARRKNLPEAVRVKCDLSDRLRQVRTELFGERGGSEMARRLGLPVRTWYNYEAGVTVPAEVLLRFMELTSVEPMWLLYGSGPKYRAATPPPGAGPAASVGALLRTALERLEQMEGAEAPRLVVQAPDAALDEDVVLVGVDGPAAERLTDASGPRYVAARREWLAAQRDCRCIRVEGDAMAPIVADGAYVAYSAEEEHPDALEGKLVVAWSEGRPIVRWFARSGRYALLRAENPNHEPNTMLIDLGAPARERRIRRVLWISTPH